MTSTFIYVIFGIIIVYDIAMGIYDKEYITTVFRRWFKEKSIVPLMFGILLFHFQSLVVYANIPLFIILSVSYMLWFMIMQGSNIKWSRKFYDVSNKCFFIPFGIGSLLGILWH